MSRIDTSQTLSSLLPLYINVRILLLVVSLLQTGSAGADNTPAPDISELRAAYYFNALKFARWRQDPVPNQTIIIVLLGKDPVCSVLAGKLPQLSISGRHIEVTQISDLQSTESNQRLPDRLHGADAIYFAEDAADIYTEILSALDNTVLTASSIPAFADHGGMIEIAIDPNGQELEFHINTRAVKASEVTISSQLLKISKIIDSLPAQGSRQQ